MEIQYAIVSISITTKDSHRIVKIVVYATLLKRGNSLTLMKRLVHTLKAVKAL